VVLMTGKGFSNFFQIGSEFGIVVIWAIALSLVFKFSLVDGLARYTIHRGESVFSGVANLPGPKNWGVWTVTFVYTFELAYIAGIAVLAGQTLDALAPIGISSSILAAICVLSVVALLLFRPLSVLEKVAYMIVGSVLCMVVYSAIAALIGPDASSGNLPSTFSFDVFQVLGSGSGLSLLLYSVYVSDKARSVEGHDPKGAIKGIRTGLAIAFVMTGLILIGMVIVASSNLSGNMLDAASNSLSSLPFASSLFIFTIFCLMFGIVLLGVDGRARAISKMLRQSTITTMDRKGLYRRLVVLFTFVIVLTIWFGRPEDIINFIAAISSALFALTGFALVYVNRKMPQGLKAGSIWVAVTLVGSTIFLAVALISEQTMLEFGLPMLARMVGIALFLYALQRTKVLSWIIDNARYWGGGIAALVLFSAISILGTVGGVEFGGLIINFRDLGAIMAGLVGGPVIGGLVGLVGGSFRYGLGGWTALPCFVATVSAGVVSGLASWYWKGKVSYLKVMVLGGLVEAMHLLLYFPLLTPSAPSSQVLDMIRVTIVPMTVTILLGLIMFIYIISMRRFDLHPSLVITRKPNEIMGAEEVA
jgi:hypothetical protein